MDTRVRRRRPKVGRVASWWMIAALGLAAGCGASAQERRHDGLSAQLARAPERGGDRGSAQPGGPPAPRPTSTGHAPSAAGMPPAPFDAPVLSRAALVGAVLARNPSLEAARESAQAALSMYGRETAIDDPMVEYAIAPLSIASDGPLGHSVRITQRLPWPGKRAAAGERVLAEAEAAASDRQAARVELAAMASMLFDQLWMSDRALRTNTEHAELLASTLRGVRDALAVGGATQAEVLMVELEDGRVARDRLQLEAERAATCAQLNALLHRAPDAPLPPPAADDPVLASSADAGDAERPELVAQRLRIRAAREEVTEAERERYPDLLLMGEYTSMNMEPAHRLMVGVGIELPLQQGARDASVDAASARMRAAERQLEALSDRLQSEVVGARERTRAAEQAAALYQERLVPTGRARLEAEGIAQANGTGSLANVLQAERELRTLELESIEATATLGERRAQLAAALGRFPIDLEDAP